MRRRVLQIVLASLFLAGLPASAQESLFELHGRLVLSSGKGSQAIHGVVQLRGSTNPFSTETTPDAGGRFRFKKLRAGTYTLHIHVSRIGEMQQTIEIGPAFADRRGRITREFSLDDLAVRDTSFSVSAFQLAVPDKAQSEYRKALKRLEKRDVAGAVALLEKAVEIAPQFSAAWNHLGTIAYQSRDYTQAESYFRIALEKDPESFAPLVNLGGALLSLGRLVDSLAVNLQAAKRRPEDALAQAQLGQSYFFLGNFDDAERHLKASKSRDPAHFSLPQLVLAEIYLKRQDHAAAEKELAEFLQLHPDSPLAGRVAETLDKLRQSPSP